MSLPSRLSRYWNPEARVGRIANISKKESKVSKVCTTGRKAIQRDTLLSCALLMYGLLIGRTTAQADPAELDGVFDAASFGFPLQTQNDHVVGVRWAEPRKIRRVVVEFPGAASLPDPTHEASVLACDVGWPLGYRSG